MLVTSVTVRVALPASSLSEGVGMLRRRYLALVVFFAMLSTLFPFAREAAAVSTGVVISQVYGGGGNSGATLKNDFIELFNRGSAAIDVSAWSVQYASMLGTSWQRTNLSGSIAPGQYYLVQEAAGAGGTTNLPTPDARSEEHTSELQSLTNLVCRLLLEK